jgi:hypothetical protein
MTGAAIGRRVPQCHAWRVVGCALAAAAVAGCASTGGDPGASASAAAPASAVAPSGAPPPASFNSRVKSFFSGNSSDLSSPPSKGNSDFECPTAEQRQGAATYAVNEPGSDSALSLQYQANFTQIARECIVRGTEMTIKVGVEGRIIVGPAGAPATINIPLRYALVREGLEPKVIWTKLYVFPVQLPPGDLNAPFVNIQEEMTATIPRKLELENYVVYVGFDPDGVAAPKPAAKPRTARSK